MAAMTERDLAIRRALRRLLTGNDPSNPSAVTRVARRAYARLVAAWNGWGLSP